MLFNDAYPLIAADPGQRRDQEGPGTFDEATRIVQCTLRSRRIIERLKRRREEAV